VLEVSGTVGSLRYRGETAYNFRKHVWALLAMDMISRIIHGGQVRFLDEIERCKGKETLKKLEMSNRGYVHVTRRQEGVT